jgi:peroxiredoxin
MDMQQELRNRLTEFERTAPAGRAALYQAKVEELTAAFSFSNALALGDDVEDFTLPDAQGKPVSLSSVVQHGPAILTFYRGGWCPYCNIQLRAYQQALGAFASYGARLVAISPQMPDESLTTVQRNALAFDVLSDAGNRVARAFGLVYVLPDELQAALRSNGKDLSEINGDPSWELPITATYVVSQDRRVALAYVDTDYRQRLSVEQILAALQTLQAGPGTA